MSYENEYDYTEYTLSPFYTSYEDMYKEKEFREITYEELKSFIRFELDYGDLFYASKDNAKLYVKFEDPYEITLDDLICILKNMIKKNACCLDMCSHIDGLIYSNDEFNNAIILPFSVLTGDINDMLLDEDSFLCAMFNTLLSELDIYPAPEIINEFLKVAIEYKEGFSNEYSFKDHLKSFVFFHLVTKLDEEDYTNKMKKFILKTIDELKDKSLYFMDAALGFVYKDGVLVKSDLNLAKLYLEKAFIKYQNHEYAEELGDIYNRLIVKNDDENAEKSFKYFSFARNASKSSMAGMFLIDYYTKGIGTVRSLYIANNIAMDIFNSNEDLPQYEKYDSFFPEVSLRYSEFLDKGIMTEGLPKLALNTILKGKIFSKNRIIFLDGQGMFSPTDYHIFRNYLNLCDKNNVERKLNKLGDGYYISTEDTLIMHLDELFDFSYYHIRKDYVELIFNPKKHNEYIICESIGFVSFDEEVIIRLENFDYESIDELRKRLQTKPDFFIHKKFLAIKKDKSYVLKINDGNNIDIKEKNNFDDFKFENVSLVLPEYDLKTKTRIVRLKNSNNDLMIELFKDNDKTLKVGDIINCDNEKEKTNNKVEKIYDLDEDQLSFCCDLLSEI